MTNTSRHHKPARFKYGTPDGWDFNNGIVAFGTNEEKRGAVTGPKKKERKKRRL